MQKMVSKSPVGFGCRDRTFWTDAYVDHGVLLRGVTTHSCLAPRINSDDFVDRNGLIFGNVLRVWDNGEEKSNLTSELHESTTVLNSLDDLLCFVWAPVEARFLREIWGRNQNTCATNLKLHTENANVHGSQWPMDKRRERFWQIKFVNIIEHKISWQHRQWLVMKPPLCVAATPVGVPATTLIKPGSKITVTIHLLFLPAEVLTNSTRPISCVGRVLEILLQSTLPKLKD